MEAQKTPAPKTPRGKRAGRSKAANEAKTKQNKVATAAAAATEEISSSSLHNYINNNRIQLGNAMENV